MEKTLSIKGITNKVQQKFKYDSCLNEPSTKYSINPPICLCIPVQLFIQTQQVIVSQFENKRD